jgi:integration host factor subunit alpha
LLLRVENGDNRPSVYESVDPAVRGKTNLSAKGGTIMSLTKIDIIDTVYEKLGIPRKECIRIVESVFEIIKDDLDKGHGVMISGFGKWTVKAKKRRKGRNPQTGEALMIDARKVVTFKPSSVLRNAVNSAG